MTQRRHLIGSYYKSQKHRCWLPEHQLLGFVCVRLQEFPHLSRALPRVDPENPDAEKPSSVTTHLGCTTSEATFPPRGTVHLFVIAMVNRYLNNSDAGKSSSLSTHPCSYSGGKRFPCPPLRPRSGTTTVLTLMTPLTCGYLSSIVAMFVCCIINDRLQILSCTTALQIVSCTTPLQSNSGFESPNSNRRRVVVSILAYIPPLMKSPRFRSIQLRSLEQFESERSSSMDSCVGGEHRSSRLRYAGASLS